MNTSSKAWKITAIIVGVVIVVGIVLAIIFLRPNGAKNGADTDNTSLTATNNVPAGSANSSGSAASASPANNTITIHLVTPISGNVWTAGNANPIAWDNAANVTGEIDLVTADTKQFVGIILAETGVKQTSYTWDARQIYLGRYGADEKAVVPGKYSIRIHFDGNGFGDLVSGPITITD